MAKEIPIKGGHTAIVDDEFYDELSKFKWYLSTGGYALRNGKGRKGGMKYMHREVFALDPGKVTDHINKNKLDNRLENLRSANKAQNRVNSKASKKNNCIDIKGVYKIRNFFRAQITFSGSTKYLGQYKTIEEAARAYDVAAIKQFGEFAYTNYPRSNYK